MLCRTDIFHLLQGANKNKIRQDYSIDLDWNTNPKAPATSPLLAIANLRAEISLGCKMDVLGKFFPRRFEGRSTKKLLLDMTRHTPRDFLQLMSYAGASCQAAAITTSELRNAVREYSAKYFLPEIQDELQGYATADEIRGVLDSIENISSREFSLKQLRASAVEIGWHVDEPDLLKVLRALYECSAIGNIRRASRGKRYLSFKYRNRSSNFKKNERIILHRGMWRAFNIQWKPFGTDVDPDMAFEK